MLRPLTGAPGIGRFSWAASDHQPSAVWGWGFNFRFGVEYVGMYPVLTIRKPYSPANQNLLHASLDAHVLTEPPLCSAEPWVSKAVHSRASHAVVATSKWRKHLVHARI